MSSIVTLTADARSNKTLKELKVRKLKIFAKQFLKSSNKTLKELKAR